MAQHVSKLVATGAGIDRHEYRAADRCADHGVDELGVVLHQQRKPVAWRHARLFQGGRDAAAILPELAVGPDLGRAALMVESQHVAVRLRFHTVGNQVGQGQFITRGRSAGCHACLGRAHHTRSSSTR